MRRQVPLPDTPLVLCSLESCSCSFHLLLDCAPAPCLSASWRAVRRFLAMLFSAVRFVHQPFRAIFGFSGLGRIVCGRLRVLRGHCGRRLVAVLVCPVPGFGVCSGSSAPSISLYWGSCCVHWVVFTPRCEVWLRFSIASSPVFPACCSLCLFSASVSLRSMFVRHFRQAWISCFSALASVGYYRAARRFSTW